MFVKTKVGSTLQDMDCANMVDTKDDERLVLATIGKFGS